MAEVTAFGLSVALPLLYQRLHQRDSRGAEEKEQESTEFLRSLCTVSAPGKILIAGGYLVLENPNAGVTISATARFHTTVQSQLIQQKHKDSSLPLLQIIVDSPQFGSEYLYALSLENVLSSRSELSNPFVEKCLVMTFSYILQHTGSGEFQRILSSMISNGLVLKIILRADNDFYSQMSELDKRGLPYLSQSLTQLPKFINCPKGSDGELVVAKTGMGSSAALTTSLVGSLLQFFGIIDLQSTSSTLREADRSIIHNLSQLIHSVAQGKIGSGFDVAAAVYGSQIYRRFSESKIPFDRLISDDPNGELLYSTVRDRSLWDQDILPFHLPCGMDIVMGDVCGGSSSSSMAKAVLSWKKNGGEFANELWNRIRDTNETISTLLVKLSSVSDNEQKREIYHEIREIASMRRNTEWSSIPTPSPVYQEVLDLLLSIRDSFISVRADLKLMGRSAGTEIEPDQQTLLADATTALPGVLCSGVPGAGGIDAIYALVLSSDARQNVEQMWSTWDGQKSAGCRVCPLLLSVDQGKHAGIQLEPPIIDTTCG